MKCLLVSFQLSPLPGGCRATSCQKLWPSVMGQIRPTRASRSVSCCIFVLEKRTRSPIRHNLVLKFLLWCAHCFCVQVTSRLFGDERCVAQITFDLQELSCLISLRSTYTVQQQKTCRIRTDSSNPRVFMSLTAYFVLSNESMLSSPFSRANAFLTSKSVFWNHAALRLPRRIPPSSPQTRLTQSICRSSSAGRRTQMSL